MLSLHRVLILIFYYKSKWTYIKIIGNQNKYKLYQYWFPIMPQYAENDTVSNGFTQGFNGFKFRMYGFKLPKSAVNTGFFRTLSTTKCSCCLRRTDTDFSLGPNFCFCKKPSVTLIFTSIFKVTLADLGCLKGRKIEPKSKVWLYRIPWKEPLNP